MKQFRRLNSYVPLRIQLRNGPCRCGSGARYKQCCGTRYRLYKAVITPEDVEKLREDVGDLLSLPPMP